MLLIKTNAIYRDRDRNSFISPWASSPMGGNNFDSSNFGGGGNGFNSNFGGSSQFGNSNSLGGLGFNSANSLMSNNGMCYVYSS